MRESLARWIGDADALLHVEQFRARQSSLELMHVQSRLDDFYLGLVGALFELMRGNSPNAADWARLGNALAQIASTEQEERLRRAGISKEEATLLAAAAFYCGGYPASASLTIRTVSPTRDSSESYRACFDLMGRPSDMHSRMGRWLVGALRRGDMQALAAIGDEATQQAASAIDEGPEAWIAARLFEKLAARFLATNVRAVLPDGGSDFWTPFVGSLLDRRVWEFFPSQIEALNRGLLAQRATFSLQMPTGAGKTALCETLLYWHAKRTASEVAILLVPYRSLASELRGTVVKRLNKLGVLARCAYGGTVPTGDESGALDEIRVVVATPEALSGLLGADGDFYQRISLVICDEGHLLDGGGRGVGLELLLARMRARKDRPLRFVFVSAIVPNIEEINAWLGGSSESVVHSDYRPAIAEFAVLRGRGNGGALKIWLDVHPHEQPPTRYWLEEFLSRRDFEWTNPATGRQNTYAFTSIKAQAIATARKALPMGVAAVFAANKRGAQGADGLAEELLNQLDHQLPLPTPLEFADADKVDLVRQYLDGEYGATWLGTRALAAGAVLHHGDIPQESREVLETLLRQHNVRFVVCTSTLAEGVNLPIRTLVLYSVQRRTKSGRAESLLARDIKNLVGRAGRAGATTKGLVICANEQQWGQVEQVARQTPGESVRGALIGLVERLQKALASRNIPLTNSILEATPLLHTLVDGIDATLIDLVAEEIGEDALVAEAVRLADQTFASQQADTSCQQLLQNVFVLRAQRVMGLHNAGRLDWVRTTGARARVIDAVESGLLDKRATWDDILDPLDTNLIAVVLDWAWAQPDLRDAVREAFRLDDDEDVAPLKPTFVGVVTGWLNGMRFKDIATSANLDLDMLLGVQGRVVTYALQTLVEQGIPLLEKLVEAQGRNLSPAVLSFPEHLRFGTPTIPARVLAAGGVRHRNAAVELGRALVAAGIVNDDRAVVFAAAGNSIFAHREAWEQRLGSLVFNNTLLDVSGVGEAPNKEPQDD